MKYLKEIITLHFKMFKLFIACSIIFLTMFKLNASESYTKNNKHQENIFVKHNLFKNQKDIDGFESRPNRWQSRNIIPSYNRSRKTFYANYLIISANILDLKGFGFTYGFFPARYFPDLVENMSIKFSYQTSKQKYTSMYMKLPKEPSKIKFHEFGLGLAFDIEGKISSDLLFVFTPDFEIGLELPQTNKMLFDENIDGLRTIYFKPGIKTAFFIGRYGLSVGLSYYFFESYVRELNKNILIDNITAEPISYSKDLFPGREGLQLSFGIIFKF